MKEYTPADLAVYEMFRQTESSKERATASHMLMGLLQKSDESLARKIVNGLSELQIIWSNNMYPASNYLLLERKEFDSAEVRGGIPDFFDSMRLKHNIAYGPYPVNLIDPPEHDPQFLDACIKSVVGNKYRPDVSMKAVEILSLFGGPEQIRQLGKNLVDALIEVERLKEKINTGE